MSTLVTAARCPFLMGKRLPAVVGHLDLAQMLPSEDKG